MSASAPPPAYSSEKAPDGQLQGYAPPPYPTQSGSPQNPPGGYSSAQPQYPPSAAVAYQANTPQGAPAVVHQPITTATFPGQVTNFGESPVTTVCPHCQATVTTSTSTKAGALSWLICLVLLFVGCWLGCCLIPFCISALHDVIHSCPNCKAVISVSKKIS